jgi:ABC-type transport system involved in multi-copper enzyme maturation permease subunit
MALTVALALAFGCGLTALLGQTAITETREIQAVLAAAFFRFAAVLIIAVFVIVSQARESADKGLELLLSLPISRAPYLLGKLAGYVTTAWLCALIFSLPLLFFGSPGSVAVWGMSLGLELTLVAAASLFFAMTLSQPSGALAAVVGFYLLSRSMAAFQLIGTSSLLEEGIVHRVINFALDAIATVLPRLDLFTQSAWLADMAGRFALLPSLLLQTAVYAALLIGGALFDLYRKEL